MTEVVLITGATGFIGANLAHTLVTAGKQVHITTREHSDCWRIHAILPQLQQHVVDLRDMRAVDKLINTIKPTVVFHLASYGVYRHQNDEQTITDSNVAATENLLKALSGANSAHLIYAGSCFEYGYPETVVDETMSPDPQDSYANSKLAATHLIQQYATAGKVRGTVLRLFTAYGPFEAQERLVPSVINACLQGSELKLGSREQVRDFVYIADVVQAFIAAANKAPGKGEIINIGAGNRQTVGDVVDTVLALTKNSINPQWQARPDFPNSSVIWQADISKAKDLLGWQPTTSLTAGLTQSIAWMESNK